MKKLFFSAAVISAVFCLASAAVGAPQEDGAPPAGRGRGRGAPRRGPGGPVPRLSDGKPDFSGIWNGQQLVAPAKAPQLLLELQHGAAQDALLVVDGDDDRDVDGIGHWVRAFPVAGGAAPRPSMSDATSRPASTQSSMALYVHEP